MFLSPSPPQKKFSPPCRQYSFSREHWAHTSTVFAEPVPMSSTESRYFPMMLMRLCYWKFWLPEWLLNLLYCVHKEAHITVSQTFPIIFAQCISTRFISLVFLCISLYAFQYFCWGRELWEGTKKVKLPAPEGPSSSQEWFTTWIPACRHCIHRLASSGASKQYWQHPTLSLQTAGALFAGAVKYFDIQTTIGKYWKRICPRVRGLCYEQSLGMLKLTLPKRKKQSSEGLQQLDLPSFHPTPHSRILGMLSLSI